MKKTILACIVAIMVVSMSAVVFAGHGKWGTDNGYCAQWVNTYSDWNNGVTLGNNPFANTERIVKGNSPHQRLAYFMQLWACGV